tara:strand:- start:19267 stop:20631 length:1365 start_codon:yes stop_codon:yes gene_type:complete
MTRITSHSESSKSHAVPVPQDLWKNNAITASQLFDRKSTSKLALVTTFSLFVILAAAIGWASYMPITEISASSGEVVPSGALQNIQHLEGGIVSKVNVSEGQQVTEGQILVELSPHIAQSELEQLQTRLTTLQFRIRFLTAARGDNIPDIEEFDPEYEDIASAVRYELVARRDSIDSQINVLNQQLREREAELATITSQAKALESQISLTREQVTARRTLVEKGVFPRMQLIENERELARLTGDRTSILLEAARIREGIGEAQQRIMETRARYQSEIATELSGFASQAAEARVAIARAEDRVARLFIRAPLSGRIQGLETRTIGGVIEPGATLMEIVPDGTNLLVEARISTSDIGHVHLGQPANIKVLTYDYSRFGTIKGHINQISPTTFIDEKGIPYYKADIELEKQFVGENTEMSVSPGMTVLADIITGEKTLLTLMLSPVLKSFDSAFRER